MQEEFQGLNDTPPDLWVPATMYGAVIKQDLFGVNQPRSMALVGRLRRDVTADQAGEALSPLLAYRRHRQLAGERVVAGDRDLLEARIPGERLVRAREQARCRPDRHDTVRLEADVDVRSGLAPIRSARSSA